MSLRPVAEGVWTEDRRLDLPGGLKLPIRMTVLRDHDGGLSLISPVRFDEALRAEVAALGEVRAIVGPNLYHHLYLRSALEHFPKAELFLAPGLAAKRPNLPKSHPLDGRGSPLGASIEAIPVAGAPKMNEVVFAHTPSRTLVVTDLFLNVVRPASFVTALYLSLSGARGTLAQSRVWRFLVKDRSAHRASLEAIFARPIEAVVMAHGEVSLLAGDPAAARAGLLPW